MMTRLSFFGSMLLVLSMVMLPAAAIAQPSEAGVLVFTPGKARNMACSSDGKSLTVPIQGKVDAGIELPSGALSGWQKLTGEYQTTGMSPLGAFVLDIYGGKAASWQSISAASAWAPFQVCFQATGGVCTLRIIGEPGKLMASGSGQIQFRNLKITSYVMPSGQELLGNPDFSIGKIGELPSHWNWNYNAVAGDYALIVDKSFQTGSQVLVVKSDSQKARTVQGSKLPMPVGGRMTFSVWARSDDADVTIKMFLLSSDFKWGKDVNAPLSSGWMKYTVTADVPENMPDLWLYPRVDVKGTGTVRLAGASLIWLNKESATLENKKADEESKKSVEAAASGNGQWGNSRYSVINVGKNMLQNPDMELGYNGWLFDYFPMPTASYAVKQIHAEECRLLPGAGMDGGTAMLVSEKTCLTSNGVPLVPGKTYTFSLYIKAIKPGASTRIFLIDPSFLFYTTTIKDIPTDRWERYSITKVWELPATQKKFYVRVDPQSGSVLVDRLQLEEGPLSEYESPAVMMGVVAKNKVFSPNAPVEGLTANIILSGKVASPLKVDMHVQDVWGKEVYHQPLAVPSGSRVSIPLKGLPSDRLGVFVIALTATDSSGKLLSRVESRYAVLEPSKSAILSTGFPLMGMNYPDSRAIWMRDRDLAIMAQTGVRSIRVFPAIDCLEDESYIKALREQIKLHTKYGMDTMINIMPPFQLHNGLYYRINDEEEPSAEAYQEWAQYLRKAVYPLKDVVRYWEILNEPNIWRVEKGPRKGQKSITPEKYIQVLRTGYDAIKSIDPSLQVIGICPSGADFDYTNAVMKLGAAKWMDIYAVHPYRAAPDNPDTYADFVKMKTILKSHGFNGPMMNTEQYYAANLFRPHNGDNEVIRGYYAGEKEEMAATGRILHGYIHHAAAEVPWYNFEPRLNTIVFGVEDPYFLYYTVGGLNAISRILDKAGPGQPIRVSGDVRAFLFPQAVGGPVLTMFTVLPEISGSMKLVESDSFVTFDMMGNIIPHDQIRREGIPIQVSPIYIRFPEGTTVEQVQQMVTQASYTGLGDPFGAKMTVMSDGRLGIVVTNRTMQPVSGKVTVRDYPKNWKITNDMIGFGPLAGNASTIVTYDGQILIQPMSDYALTVSVSANDKFVRKDLKLSPVFASMTDRPAIGGPTTPWTNWVELSENHLSFDYSRNNPHAGVQDLSAKMALGWDKDGLTMVVVVTDDVAGFPTRSGDYNADSLQIYFDQLNNAEKPTSIYDNDDVTYHVSLVNGKPIAIIEKGTDGRYVGAANQTTGLDTDVESSIVRQDNQTIYQLRFPSKCFPLVKFESGQTLGFSILINDNDGQGRKAGLTLAPKGSEPYNRPYYYKTLILR